MIRLATSVAVIALYFLAQSVANAFEGTGTELQLACSEPKGTQGHNICIAFVSGVYEGMWASQRLFTAGVKSCLPALSDEDLVAVVGKYMRARPEMLNDPMAAIVSASLVAEFRCK